MGSYLEKTKSKSNVKKKLKIIILGLQNSGKTSLLNKLHKNTVTMTAPTIGYNMEILTYNNIDVEMWDLGGYNTIRKQWQIYYPNTNAIIYIIDSHDKFQFPAANQELKILLEKDYLKGLPLLVLANKQDIPEVESQKSITNALNLWKIKNRRWTIFKCSVLTGLGLNQAMDWLFDILSTS